jgi:hypothetical protein
MFLQAISHDLANAGGMALLLKLAGAPAAVPFLELGKPRARLFAYRNVRRVSRWVNYEFPLSQFREQCSEITAIASEAAIHAGW